MSVTANIVQGLTVRETLTGAQVAGSTPPATQVSAQTLTGTQTIDLTALPTEGGAVNATGLKVRAALITNKAGNTGALAIGGGANPYLLLGGVTISLPVGATLQVYFADGLLAVGATNKLLLFTPNNAGDSYNVQLVVG
jgi:hypothetical protein